MSGIFISYRREDASAYARLLSEALAAHFGRAEIFRDVETLSPGADFPQAIAEAVGRCDALLALIGRRWLVAEREGKRRLDDPSDYVRLEIAAALERHTLVVPILMEDTRMPSREELPDSLAELADRNALRLTDDTWNDGVNRLVEAVEKVVALADAGSRASGSAPDAGFGAAGDHISAHVAGPVSGQVAVGKHIVQEQAATGAAPEVSAAEKAELARVFAHLQDRIRTETPPSAVSGALDRLDELEEAVYEDEPDVTTIKYVQEWFAEQLPRLASPVAEVADHPVFRKLVHGGGV